jgi:glycosyltransferase involved in cell wall biosynthesis
VFRSAHPVVEDNVAYLPVRSGRESKLPVSCFIITKNEADRIGRCIASVVQWVDEVIVIDSGSSDDTVPIARRAGAKVMYNQWPGFGQQKRYAEDQCRNHWVLNLDADEIATPDLKSELVELFKSGEPEFAAYRLPVHIVYPGRNRPRLFAKDHTCIRVYDRRRVRFKDSTLHDSVDPGHHPVGGLRSVVFHHTFSSFKGLIAKCDERATYSALHASYRSPGMLRLRAFAEWPLVFTKYYVFRRHMMAGLDGLVFAAIMAHYRQARIIRMLAQQAHHESSTAGTNRVPDLIPVRTRARA